MVLVVLYRIIWNLYKSKIDGRVSIFVGMDLHKNFLQVAVMDKKGKVLRNSKIDNDLKHVSKFFKSINSREKPLVVMESSSVWYNIYRYLSEGGYIAECCVPNCYI